MPSKVRHGTASGPSIRSYLERVLAAQCARGFLFLIYSCLGSITLELLALSRIESRSFDKLGTLLPTPHQAHWPRLGVSAHWRFLV